MVYQHSKATFFLLLGLAGAPGLALAQGTVDPEIINAQTGDWLVGRQDGKPGCVLTLGRQETIGGYSVEHADSCDKSIASIADVSAWNFDGDGGVLLIDPLRKVKAHFVSDEGGALSENEENSDHLLMVPAVSGIDHLPAVAELKGDWIVKDPKGKALCSITLDDKVDAAENLTATVAKGCAVDIKGLKITSWSLDGLGLILLGSDGDSLVLEMTANGFEAMEEDGGKPLLMVRR